VVCRRGVKAADGSSEATAPQGRVAGGAAAGLQHASGWLEAQAATTTAAAEKRPETCSHAVILRDEALSGQP